MLFIKLHRTIEICAILLTCNEFSKIVNGIVTHNLRVFRENKFAYSINGVLKSLAVSRSHKLAIEKPGGGGGLTNIVQGIETAT